MHIFLCIFILINSWQFIWWSTNWLPCFIDYLIISSKTLQDLEKARLLQDSHKPCVVNNSFSCQLSELTFTIHVRSHSYNWVEQDEFNDQRSCCIMLIQIMQLFQQAYKLDNLFIIGGLCFNKAHFGSVHPCMYITRYNASDIRIQDGLY